MIMSTISVHDVSTHVNETLRNIQFNPTIYLKEPIASGDISENSHFSELIK